MANELLELEEYNKVMRRYNNRLCKLQWQEMCYMLIDLRGELNRMKAGQKPVDIKEIIAKSYAMFEVAESFKRSYKEDGE